MSMRPLFFAMLAAGCGLDESGIFDSQDGAPLDDVADVQPANDVTANDVAVDVASLDAGVDVIADVAPLDVITTIDAPFDAGPILTITGGTYTLLAEDAGVCSLNANTATSFDLVNDHATPVDLVWVDYACAEQAYGTLLVNGQKNQNTYVTHVWRVRNDSDKAFLGGFVLGSAGPFTVTVH
jgi:hypothetical protein